MDLRTIVQMGVVRRIMSKKLKGAWICAGAQILQELPGAKGMLASTEAGRKAFTGQCCFQKQAIVTWGNGAGALPSLGRAAISHSALALWLPTVMALSKYGTSKLAPKEEIKR